MEQQPSQAQVLEFLQTFRSEMMDKFNQMDKRMDHLENRTSHLEEETRAMRLEWREESKMMRSEWKEEIKALRDIVLRMSDKLEEVYEARNTLQMKFGWSWGLLSLIIAVSAAGMVELFGA